VSWLFAPQLRPFVLLAAAAALALNLALLAPALYMVQVFDRVLASRSVETLAMLSALAALALVFGYCMDVVRTRALNWIGAALDRRLSPAALREILRERSGPSGRADTDALRDIALLRGFLTGSGVQSLFDAPWFPIYLAIIALMHPLLGVTAATGMVLLFAIALATEKLTRGRAERVLQSVRTAKRDVERLARNAEVVIGMGMSGAAVARWQTRQDEALVAQSRHASVSARLGALARMSRQALQVAMLAVGAWLVIRAHASPGIMIAATILLGRALQPVEHLIAGWKSHIDARGAWQRLCTRSAPGTTDAKLALPAPRGRVEVERLVFAPVTGRPGIIRNVSFTLAAGESLGVVGPSASGKTTLARLLLGLWTPQSGVVRLDGADIAQWDRDALGKYVGYVPQDVELFAGTVADNIGRLGRADADAVVAAARLAHAHDMILRLPQGYDTDIGEGGAVLSGGQRQRIALARALYGEPRLVVLDEPNANLDSEGDEALKAALHALKARGVTVVMVGHRPALMSQLDKLAVMKEGTLDAFGPSAAILARLRAVPRRATHPIAMVGSTSPELATAPIDAVAGPSSREATHPTATVAAASKEAQA
jgi:PrtD family type I secretion system ABC transporter